jgi:hypothetical protein
MIKVQFSLCLNKYHAMKMCLCLIKHHVIKTCGGVEVYFHAFLTLALDGCEQSGSRSESFTPGERARQLPTGLDAGCAPEPV